MKNLVLVVFLVFMCTSCSNDNGNNVGGAGWIDPYLNSEILVTNDIGEILGGDFSDWCFPDTSQVSNQFSFGPVYPNPVKWNTFTVRFEVRESCTVDVFFLEGTTPSYLMQSRDLQAGLYLINAHTMYLPFQQDTIVKLYLKARQGTYNTIFQCDGDIQFDF